MAWTKAKTAAVATVAVMLTAGTTILAIKTIHRSRVAVYQPIPDKEPEITTRVRGLKLEELHAEDCTPEFWQQLQQSRQSENPDIVKAVAAAVGPLREVTLIERTEDHGRPSKTTMSGQRHAGRSRPTNHDATTGPIPCAQGMTL